MDCPRLIDRTAVPSRSAFPCSFAAGGLSHAVLESYPSNLSRIDYVLSSGLT
jgi:hypothetical protein